MEIQAKDWIDSINVAIRKSGNRIYSLSDLAAFIALGDWSNGVLQFLGHEAWVKLAQWLLDNDEIKRQTFEVTVYHSIDSYRCLIDGAILWDTKFQCMPGMYDAREVVQIERVVHYFDRISVTYADSCAGK